jgi:hypothetical protein
MSSHKTFRIKQFLAKEQRQDRFGWKLVTKSGTTPTGDTRGEPSWVGTELHGMTHIFLLYHGQQLFV